MSVCVISGSEKNVFIVDKLKYNDSDFPSEEQWALS